MFITQSSKRLYIFVIEIGKWIGKDHLFFPFHHVIPQSLTYLVLCLRRKYPAVNIPYKSQ